MMHRKCGSFGYVVACLLLGCSFVAEGVGYPSDTDSDDENGDGQADADTDEGGDIGDSGDATGSGDGSGEGGDASDESGSDSDGGTGEGDGETTDTDDGGTGETGDTGNGDSDDGDDSDTGDGDGDGDGDTDDGGTGDKEDDGDDTGDGGGTGDDWTEECPKVAAPVALGTVQNPALSAISGLAASYLHDYVVWLHNDSPDTKLYALGINGTQRGTFTLSGVPNANFEDIAVGPGPQPGVPYVYMADIGKPGPNPNQGHVIYRFPEPELPALGTTVTAIDAFDTLSFAYPNGADYDAKTVMVDPLTTDIFIVVSADSGHAKGSQVFRFPYPQSTTSVTNVTAVARARVDGQPITGGDISPQGDQILLRTGTEGGPAPAARLWLRGRQQSIAQAFTGEPCAVPISSAEPKGEAVGFGVLGKGYLTSSESSGVVSLPQIHFYGYE